MKPSSTSRRGSFLCLVYMYSWARIMYTLEVQVKAGSSRASPVRASKFSAIPWLAAVWQKRWAISRASPVSPILPNPSTISIVEGAQTGPRQYPAGS